MHNGSSIRISEASVIPWLIQFWHFPYKL